MLATERMGEYMVGFPLAFDETSADVTSAASLGKDLFSFEVGKRLSEHTIAQFVFVLPPSLAKRAEALDKDGIRLKLVSCAHFLDGTPIHGCATLSSLCTALWVASVTKTCPRDERNEERSRKGERQSPELRLKPAAFILRHDPQKCGELGRNGFDDGSLAVGVRFQRGQCSAGRGRTRGALLVIHRCVWLLHPDGVL